MALFIGCCDSSSDEKNEESQNIQIVKSITPTNTIILEDLGRCGSWRTGHETGWAVIEMNVLSKSRKYLLNWWKGAQGQIGSSMVEVKDE